ncbi:hypothetical protein GE09DRAFT_1211229 [Coniochaeta sp. 2T2.1]|nr:hypothetical protein GE09DRAFT_1211229 [Coniochaeta sp. 2T2.1]
MTFVKFTRTHHFHIGSGTSRTSFISPIPTQSPKSYPSQFFTHYLPFKPSNKTSPAGGPPVSRDGFTFINNEFFAESPNHHWHRRATPAELKAHFDSGSDKDKPAHWFEAQLIHDGLPPSKTKAVARMRLFDAVKDNIKKLAVPGHIGRLEAELKKERVRNDRDVKKGVTTTTSAKGAAGGGKRKAEEDAKGGEVKKAKGTPVKEMKVKATPAAKATATHKKAADKSAATKKATENKPTVKKSTPAKPPAASKKAPEKKPDDKPVVKKQTAPPRWHRAVPVYTPTTSSITSSASRPPDQADCSPPTASGGRTKQTARRSTYGGRPRASLTTRAQPPAPGASEPPPPYSEFDDGGSNDGYGRYDDEDDDGYGDYDDESDEDDGGFGYDEEDEEEQEVGYDNGDTLSGPLPSLGPFNGHYSLTSDTVSGEWPMYGDEFSLTLTLSGQQLWGSFDLGIVEGVLRINQRPYGPSEGDVVEFRWRGRETSEGQVMYSNTGWMRFLGGGGVEGELDYPSIGFEGQRDEGQGTRSGVPVAEMRSMWEGYSEEEYERARVGRWR